MSMRCEQVKTIDGCVCSGLRWQDMHSSGQAGMQRRAQRSAAAGQWGDAVPTPSRLSRAIPHSTPADCQQPTSPITTGSFAWHVYLLRGRSTAKINSASRLQPPGHAHLTSTVCVGMGVGPASCSCSAGLWRPLRADPGGRTAVLVLQGSRKQRVWGLGQQRGLGRGPGGEPRRRGRRAAAVLFSLDSQHGTNPYPTNPGRYRPPQPAHLAQHDSSTASTASAICRAVIRRPACGGRGGSEHGHMRRLCVEKRTAHVWHGF